jgi:hypothetical protein
MSEIREFLHKHLQGIFDSDLETYHATTVPELTLYEWYVTPHRIEGIPFHDFMMTEAAQSGATPLTGMALASESGGSRHPELRDERPRTRFDLANYAEQRYGDTTIASYTLLISQSTPNGVVVHSYNESRVMVKFPEGWKVVHVHKSPGWNAPFQPPRGSA